MLQKSTKKLVIKAVTRHIMHACTLLSIYSCDAVASATLRQGVPGLKTCTYELVAESKLCITSESLDARALEKPRRGISTVIFEVVDNLLLLAGVPADHADVGRHPSRHQSVDPATPRKIA